MKIPLRLVSFFTSSLILMLLVCGCVAAPDKNGGDENLSEEEETFVPAPDEELDPEIQAEYDKYKENAGLAFGTYSPANASDFEYGGEDGNITILKYKGSERVVVIPEEIDGKTVTRIEAEAFSDSTVRAVYVPDSVVFIGRGAFENCDSLTTLRLPIMGDGAENTNCGYIFGALTSDSNTVAVPASLEMIIFGENVTEVEDNAMSGFKSLKAVVFTDKLVKIGQFSFYENEELLYVDLGSSVKEVGEYAFADCGSVVRIELSESCEKIGLGAFLNCESLKYLTLPFVGGSNNENTFFGYIFGAENYEWNDNFVPGSLSDLTLLDTCTEISDMAFADCTGLVQVPLPENLTEIGIRAFYTCYSIRGINIPDSVEKIGNDAFFQCRTLASVEFGEGSVLSGIGKQAFYGCESLKSIVLPDGVTVINASSFFGCKSLESVGFSNVQSIGEDAFGGCVSLKEAEAIDEEKIEEGNYYYTSVMK